MYELRKFLLQRVIIHGLCINRVCLMFCYIMNKMVIHVTLSL